MADAPLVIDVVHDATKLDVDSLVVLVEPLYGAPAVALALEAGWGSVELAAEAPDVAPIPLVSFEQPPSADQRGGRCRVRCDDLVATAARAAEWSPLLLGSPIMARPLASRIAAGNCSRVAFVPVRSNEAVRDPLVGVDRIAAEAWWSAGMLIRVLLDELEHDGALTDAAGLAVSIAQGAEDPLAQLGAGSRWRRHLDRGGHPDDLRIASTVDSVGVIPALLLEEDGSFVAIRWGGAQGYRQA